MIRKNRLGSIRFISLSKTLRKFSHMDLFIEKQFVDLSPTDEELAKRRSAIDRLESMLTNKSSYQVCSLSQYTIYSSTACYFRSFIFFFWFLIW
jgi:DNA polymerase sigma